jgi:hypothetical protein
MRHDEDDGSCALDCLSDIGDSNDILGKLNSREILLVLMILVNDLCQFPALKLDVSPGIKVFKWSGRASSSKTQIFTSSSNRSVCFLAFCPAILAIADPLFISSLPSHRS